MAQHIKPHRRIRRETSGVGEMMRRKYGELSISISRSEGDFQKEQ